MRIGYRTAGRTWMYTHAVARPEDLCPRHSVRNQWDLLAPLGIGACDPTRDAVEMAGGPRRRCQRLEATAAHAGIGPDAPLVVLHVSAGNPFRRWPQESFAEAIIELARRDPTRRFILTSGPSDAGRRAGDRRTASASASDRRPRRCQHGQFDIAELRALTARAAVYIGGDSGPLHIAATTQAPIVALFGPTLAERSMPWRDPRWFAEAIDAGPLPCRPCHQRTCEPGDFRCLTGISSRAAWWLRRNGR